jgi:hypothetical protein
MVKPPSPQSAIVCRPGYANCAPNALGAALAIDPHENDPKSLRFIPPLMCLASQMHAVPEEIGRQDTEPRNQRTPLGRPNIDPISVLIKSTGIRLSETLVDQIAEGADSRIQIGVERFQKKRRVPPA